jgi:hypothetical protein
VQKEFFSWREASCDGKYARMPLIKTAPQANEVEAACAVFHFHEMKALLFIHQ